MAGDERLRLAHLHVDQRRRREVLGEVPLQVRPGRAQPDPGGREQDRRRGLRLPPPRPARGHRERRLPVLDPAGAGDALRGREDLPVQPVRPDQGVAARRLPADQGRHDDAGQEPGQLLRPDRAGRLRAERDRPGHRVQPRQDAARPGVRLRRHAPLPHRPELPPAAGQPEPGEGREHLHVRRPDGLRALGRRAGLRAELLRPRLLRPHRWGRGQLGGRRRDGARGLRPARRRRRLRPGRDPGPRGLGRRPARALRRQRRRSHPRRREARDPAPRLRVLEERGRGHRQAHRGGRARRATTRRRRPPARPTAKASSDPRIA